MWAVNDSAIAKYSISKWDETKTRQCPLSYQLQNTKSTVQERPGIEIAYLKYKSRLHSAIM